MWLHERQMRFEHILIVEVAHAKVIEPETISPKVGHIIFQVVRRSEGTGTFKRAIGSLILKVVCEYGGTETDSIGIDVSMGVLQSNMINWFLDVLPLVEPIDLARSEWHT